MLKIIEIKNKKGFKKFIDLPYDIYKYDKNWIPPLRYDLMNKLVGKNNPLFSSGDHSFFMVYNDNKPLGRICVGINDDLNKKKGINEGYISLFECINDKDVAFLLFDTAVKWLKDRGMNSMRGPVSPTNGDDYKGLLVKGFDGPPVLMNSYNPEYYVKLFEYYGFQKFYDLYAYYYDLSNADFKKYGKVVEFAMKRYNYHIDKIDLKRFDREITDIKKILDISMPMEWEDLTVPSLEDIKAEVKNLKRMVDPDIIVIARSMDTPIGFAVALPDYNQVLKHLGGRLFPFGLFKLLWYKRKINSGRLFIMFVIPEYRKKGVSSAMLYKIFEEGLKKGYIYGEGSTIGETNLAMRRDVEGFGGKHYRTYRIYKKQI
ncbi:GNAT family N-acetyltransferase [Caloramator sp. E03]|uniref:GNAT family N-acetyltransferase n=1 Tax=Caloramator sp. E03 TaxID=2576307 RepID=UPI001110F382|nr:GNAT family N-acetyltransferase [Caloramator sp. E03]QCX33707.1 GNAT family N-acetyltransferase [Caloramator sp. E03]